MPLTPQQIAEARKAYNVTSDASSLDVATTKQSANDPTKATGAQLSAILRGEKYTPKDSNNPLDTSSQGDSIISRGLKAGKEMISNLADSFSKRGKDITDTTMKTADEFASANPTKQDVFDLVTGKNVADNPVIQKISAPLKNALNFVGQTAGATGDILAEGLKAGYKTLTPEQTQMKLADGIHSLMNTDAGKAGLEAIGNGMTAYEDWKAKNPDSAKAVENVLNVATLFGGKTAEEAVTPALKQGATKVVDTTIDAGIKGAKKLDQLASDTANAMKAKSAVKSSNKVLNKAFDSVTPTTADLTPAEYDELLLKGKITPKTATKPSRYVLSDAEKEIASKNAHLLQNKDPVKNSINIVQDIRKKDQAVGDFLRKNNGAFNDGELRNFLTKKMQDITDITVDPERLDAKKAQMIDNFIKDLPKNNMEELWKNRKAFDAYIEKAFSGAPTLTKELKKGLRNGVQDFIAQRTPDGVYKDYMKSMADLFDLHDIVSTKAAKEKGKNGLVLWARHNPIKAKALGWTAGSIPVLGAGYQIFK